MDPQPICGGLLSPGAEEVGSSKTMFEIHRIHRVWVELARLDLTGLRETHILWKAGPAPHHVVWRFVFFFQVLSSPSRGEVSFFVSRNKLARLRVSTHSWSRGFFPDEKVVSSPPGISCRSRKPLSSLPGVSWRA